VPVRYPALLIDAGKIRDNARTVSGLLAKRGMSLLAVAKGTMAHPAVVRAMLEGGARAVGDSRIENLRKLRDLGFSCEMVLLRAPSPSRAAEAVEVADTSLCSELATVRALGEAALRLGKDHGVVLMVDLGDLREGVLAEDAPRVAKEMARVPGVEIRGVGVNLACYGGVIPTREKMEDLLRVKTAAERAVGRPLMTVSGGNSANMMLVMGDEMPSGITELRIGESILLGTEATLRRPVPGCHQDAFLVAAEVIEVCRKPSKPFGKMGQNAFGEIRSHEDRGVRKRAVLAVGRQDVDPDSLTPCTPGVRILGASSDHLLCDVEDAGETVEVGDVLTFVPGYSALLRASTSPFVEKVVK